MKGYWSATTAGIFLLVIIASLILDALTTNLISTPQIGDAIAVVLLVAAYETVKFIIQEKYPAFRPGEVTLVDVVAAIDDLGEEIRKDRESREKESKS